MVPFSERRYLPMAGQIFMRADEVASVLGVSKPYAYKLIQKLNVKLAKTGCYTMPGRIDRKFFYEQFYGTKDGKEI
jgi:excisionase family DNA binding protein